jgi:hypothetical protein
VFVSVILTPMASGRALKRSNGNLDEAITMLNDGLVPPPDDFDLLDVQPAKGAPSKPVTSQKPKGEDPFRAGLASDAPASAVVDSRVQQLMEMGFNPSDAEKALKSCDNDFNSAVDLLTSRLEDPTA